MNVNSFSTLQFSVAGMLVPSLDPSVFGGRNASSFFTLQFGVAGILVPSLPFSFGWQKC